MWRKLPIKTLAILALVLGLAVAGAVPAGALPTLDFGIVAPTPGTIAYGGGGAALVGTNIQVDNVVGIGTPSNDGALLDITGGLLNFTTGAYTGNAGGAWHFANVGGTISITGGIHNQTNYPVGPNPDIANGTSLLSGTFLNADVFLISTTPVGGGVYTNFQIAGASFTDIKDEDLLTFFGLATGVTYNGTFNISFQTYSTGPLVAGDAFSTSPDGKVLSGDVVNVPLPSSLLLLGSGLVGLAALGSRFRKP
jgi:hypothetical protein